MYAYTPSILHIHPFTAFQRQVIDLLADMQKTMALVLTRLTQVEAKFSMSRGEALPGDMPVTLPVQSVEDVETLNGFLTCSENRKALVRFVIMSMFG